MRPGDFRFLIRTYSADDRHAEGIEPLTRDQTDAAGGGMKQHSLAFFHLINATDQVLHGQSLQHHGGGFLVGNAGRYFDQFLRAHHTRFRISPGRTAGVGNPVARLDMVYARADGLDHASAFQADPTGQRQWIQTGAMVGIDEIQANRRVAHARLACSGLSDLDIIELQHFGPADFVESHRLGHF